MLTMHRCSPNTATPSFPNSDTERCACVRQKFRRLGDIQIQPGPRADEYGRTGSSFRA
jgi:hypothetical protein